LSETNQRIADRLLYQLRAEILELKYLPGEKLSEEKISQKYQVSRSPVRVAFGLLEQEGFVVIKPQSGTFVAELPNRKIKDIMEIRIMLEVYAVRIGIPKITDEQLDELFKLYDEISGMEEGSEGKGKAVLEADQHVHDLIWELSGNTEIKRILSGYHYSIRWIQMINARYAERLPSSEEEIRALLKEIRNRNVEGACEAMRQHLLNINRKIFLNKPEGE